MKKIIFATGNEGKMKEIRRILADPQLEILSLKDAGIHADIDAIKQSLGVAFGSFQIQG